MGSGAWSRSSFESYAKSRGRSVDASGFTSTQNTFVARRIDKLLDPLNVTRECCDSEEHPESVPVILALDVTGSMGEACRRTAASINKIMTDLYTKYKDIEFMIMGIGDLAYDNAPLQVSQYESDIRIAEQLDKVYMEMGGGGNGFESYTAAWYFGVYHTKLDCWKRGRKGIIITMGDEPLNPYLPKEPLSRVTGDTLEADVETHDLYNKAMDKFDIYHIAINDKNCYERYKEDVDRTWGEQLGKRYFISSLDALPTTVTECIDDSLSIKANVSTGGEVKRNESGEIVW